MISKELRKRINELEPYLTNGRPINGNIIVDLYNEVFGPNPQTGKKVGYTSCGSCLRHRLIELINAKNMYMASLRTKKKEKKNNENGNLERD